ncbi:type II secretion system F family protein [Candidatus Saccharibacteria bacterium]|nr:type II secretion system F family protein [Candidatus Saccharibacteria bacterium]MBR3323389.1 type II secretion system F family protein [Candidatus Saccharibacteria bacterium]
MKTFLYKARDGKTGKIVKGSLKAETERSAGKLLIEQGYTPQTIKEEEEGTFTKQKVSSKDRVVFTRQFATLIGAGLPLSASLQTVANQTESKPMRRVIEDVLVQVEGGKSLYDAFSEHKDVFNNVYLSLIQAGEASGTLDESLKRLASQEEKDQAMISKIRGALTYPAIVLLVIIVVVVFMMVVVVPQVQNLYSDLGKELPFITAVLVAVANFIISYWYIVLLIGAAIIGGLVAFSKTDTGRGFFDVFKLNVPLFKGLFLRLYNARFARTAQILLATGVPMLDTLDIAGAAINNKVVEDQIKIAATKVKSGKPLSEGLSDRDYIMPLVPQMASIGEQSGKIDEMLGKAAQVYEDELDERIATLSTAIEPILMVVLAIVVGGMVAAILFPIYSLVNDVQV